MLILVVAVIQYFLIPLVLVVPSLVLLVLLTLFPLAHGPHGPLGPGLPIPGSPSPYHIDLSLLGPPGPGPNPLDPPGTGAQ